MGANIRNDEVALECQNRGHSMRFWNTLGTVSRYALAAVSSISIAQFLLLLNVGTENAGRLAGQSLGRGVISGIVAAVWFYRARKIEIVPGLVESSDSRRTARYATWTC